MDKGIPYLKNIVFTFIIVALGIWAGGCAPVTIRNFEKEGAKAYNTSDYAAALEKWQAGLELARELDEKRYIGQFLYNIGLAHDQQSRYQNALDAYQEALETYRKMD
ncbi:MAG: tetratricopeptide repeat protein, partial [Deltaproteobacteria bacterium]|nr:tetratricopeptide repeat protein [Deltaproteobacteria bacterium]